MRTTPNSAHAMRYMSLLPAIIAEMAERRIDTVELFAILKSRLPCSRSSLYRYLRGDQEMPAAVAAVLVEFFWPNGLPQWVDRRVIPGLLGQANTATRRSAGGSTSGPPLPSVVGGSAIATDEGYPRIRVHTIRLVLQVEGWKAFLDVIGKANTERLPAEWNSGYSRNVGLKTGETSGMVRVSYLPHDAEKPFARVEFEADMAPHWDAAAPLLALAQEIGIDRIDVAVDYAISMDGVYVGDRRVRVAEAISSAGRTVGLGRRGGDRYVRVYDRNARAIELLRRFDGRVPKQLADRPITRVEAELRHIDLGMDTLDRLPNPFRGLWIADLGDLNDFERFLALHPDVALRGNPPSARGAAVLAKLEASAALLQPDQLYTDRWVYVAEATRLQLRRALAQAIGILP